MSDIALGQAARLDAIQQANQLREQRARETENGIQQVREDIQRDERSIQDARQRRIDDERDVQDRRDDISRQLERQDLLSRLQDDILNDSLDASQIDRDLPRGSLVDVVA
ncbi:MAG: hypothetical protein ACPGOV_02720 [Magnetovibrionaceae bacterium]